MMAEKGARSKISPHPPVDVLYHQKKIAQVCQVAVAVRPCLALIPAGHDQLALNKPRTISEVTRLGKGTLIHRGVLRCWLPEDQIGGAAAYGMLQKLPGGWLKVAV